MSERVKVVQLIPTMADGGAETLVKDYALLCDKEKVDMHIIVWSGPVDSANERILKEAGISVLFLGMKAYEHPSSNILIRALRRLNKYRTFRRFIVDESIDVIHVHLRFGRYLMALPDKVLKRVRLIYTLHNEPNKYFDPSGSGKLRFEYDEAKRLIDKYDLTVITLHDDMNIQIRELFDCDRVITIHNGIDFNRFDPTLYDRASIRKSLKIASDSKVIGHVGSFTEQKNHEFLLRIFGEYLNKDPSAVLLLVGKGILKSRINDLINELGIGEHIISLEDRSDIPQLMCAMDVFVLPSKWEGFPVVMIEAQKIGLPCVISDRINKEVILSERISMQDIDGDINNWIDAIDGKCEYMPVSGHFDDYDIKNSIRKLEELYSK
ncbi:MAG: glycosyltransferase [Lachnospiraceae bacterium]|nr:glycosyltransferase [Lachnospiraceae bacterium]